MPQRTLLGASVHDVVLAFTDNAEDNVDRTVYTFSGLDLGTAAGNRKIVIGITGQANNRTISSVTVAGLSASAVVTVDTSSDVQALWQVDVPTGTTGDVVVTFSVGVGRCGVGVWALYNAKSAANDTDTDTGTSSVSGTIAVPAGGVAIGYVAAAAANNAVVSGTGITADFDADMEAAANAPHGGGSGAYAVADASLTITGTTTSAGRATGVFASWAPN